MAFIMGDGCWYYVDTNGQRHMITVGHWSEGGDHPWKLPSQSSESKKLAEYDVIDQQDDEERNAQ